MDDRSGVALVDEQRLDAPTLDSYYRVLADERRRIVIGLLHRRPSASVGELAEELVAHEAGAASKTRVETSLRHVHVPMTADGGVVQVDGERIDRRPSRLPAPATTSPGR